MKQFIAVLISLIFIFSSPLVFADAKKCKSMRNVLVTAFEPFGGNLKNGSALTANSLRNLKPDESCTRYQICILPVEYEKGAEKAIECFEKSHPSPDMVISTGEGDCQIRLETRAHNLNNTPGFPDNANQTLENHVIDPAADENTLLTLPIADMYCASQVALGAPTRSSNSPGFYVCNDVAFRFARYLKKKQIPFGFIHVPTASCQVEPKRTAEKINLMVKAAYRALGVPTTVFASKLPNANLDDQFIESPDTGERIPVSKVVNSQCKQKVYSHIRAELEQERKLIEKKSPGMPGAK